MKSRFYHVPNVLHIALTATNYHNKKRCLSCLFVAVDCGELDIPTNGSRLGRKTFFPNVLHFACDKGFILHGSSERQCMANGTWSGNQTFCKGI